MTTRTLIFFILLISLISNNVFAENYYSKKLCADTEKYTCIKIKRKDTWDKLFPNQKQQDLVRKLNRMNTELFAGLTIAIPSNLTEEKNILAYAPFPKQIAPIERNLIIVDLTDHAFAAYDTSGDLVRWGPISGGKSYCPDVGRRCTTPTGMFHIQSKGGAGCVSSKFPIPTGGAPMPYCMYFHGGYALHGEVMPGYHASHGCIRMFDDDAEWLNKNFVIVGDKDEATEVLVMQDAFPTRVSSIMDIKLHLMNTISNPFTQRSYYF